MAKSAEAAVLRYMDDSGTGYAFIHGQSPCLHAEVRYGTQHGLLRRRINEKG